jgi:hypothetical protein
LSFVSAKKLILNKVKKASHFVKIIVACPHRLPKQPESTHVNRQYPIRAHCSIVTVYTPIHAAHAARRGAGAATRLNICDSLPYYQPNTLAGAINIPSKVYKLFYFNLHRSIISHMTLKLN